MKWMAPQGSRKRCILILDAYLTGDRLEIWISGSEGETGWDRPWMKSHSLHCLISATQSNQLPPILSGAHGLMSPTQNTKNQFRYISSTSNIPAHAITHVHVHHGMKEYVNKDQCGSHCIRLNSNPSKTS